MCEITTVNPPQSQLIDVVADSLGQLLAMLGRGCHIVGRELDDDGRKKDDAIIIPSWRIVNLRAIGMGNQWLDEFFTSFQEV